MIEPTPLPTDYTCPEGTVPGWLNTHGFPTACVGDLPLVEPLPEPTPSRTVEPFDGQLIPPIAICGTDCFTEQPAPTPDELAATGTDPMSWLLASALLLAIGGWMLWARKAVDHG